MVHLALLLLHAVRAYEMGQIIAFGLILLLVFGITSAFLRKGLTIKPDPERKPETTYGDGGTMH
jgi:hypothetical protein